MAERTTCCNSTNSSSAVGSPSIDTELQRTNLESLPPELLANICSYLAPIELPGFAHASHICLEAANAYIEIIVPLLVEARAFFSLADQYTQALHHYVQFWKAELRRLNLLLHDNLFRFEHCHVRELFTRVATASGLIQCVRSMLVGRVTWAVAMDAHKHEAFEHAREARPEGVQQELIMANWAASHAGLAKIEGHDIMQTSRMALIKAKVDAARKRFEKGNVQDFDLQEAENLLDEACEMTSNAGLTTQYVSAAAVGLLQARMTVAASYKLRDSAQFRAEICKVSEVAGKFMVKDGYCLIAGNLNPPIPPMD